MIKGSADVPTFLSCVAVALRKTQFGSCHPHYNAQCTLPLVFPLVFPNMEAIQLCHHHTGKRCTEKGNTESTCLVTPGHKIQFVHSMNGDISYHFQRGANLQTNTFSPNTCSASLQFCETITCWDDLPSCGFSSPQTSASHDDH